MTRLIFKILVLTLAIITVSCGDKISVTPESVVIGNKLPEFSLPAIGGAEMESGSLKGQIVVLNFWATWCQPCQGEIKELKELSADPRVRIVGIALDEEGEPAVKPYVEKHQIKYTILLGNEEIFQRFNGVGIPYTLVLDRSQQIVKIYRGVASKESLLADFKKIDAEIASSAAQ